MVFLLQWSEHQPSRADLQDLCRRSIEKLQHNPYILSRHPCQLQDCGSNCPKAWDSQRFPASLSGRFGTYLDCGYRHEALHPNFRGNALIEQTTELLGVPPDVVCSGLKQALSEESVIREILWEEADFIFLPVSRKPKMCQRALRLAGKLYSLSSIEIWNRRPEVGSGAIQNQVSRFSSQSGSQCLLQRFMILTGGPGVGKTTIIRSILKCCKKVSFALAAPASRAAKAIG